MSDPAAPFETFPADVVVAVLSYLSVLDNPAAMCSRRMFYLLSEFQRLRPELVTIADWEGADGDDDMHDDDAVPLIFPKATKRLRGRPNVAFGFYQASFDPQAVAAAVHEQVRAGKYFVRQRF